jgi:lycopene beta-cyclase
MVFDVLVVGSGPAGTIVASALGDRGLRVCGLTATVVNQPWPNTYGIWQDELTALGLDDLLGHKWSNCVSYFAKGEVNHDRPYGLFDKVKLQNYLLEKCALSEVEWRQGVAKAIEHTSGCSCVTTVAGEKIQARVVIDTSGHNPIFVRRQIDSEIAFQAAYGVVGKFSQPPVEKGQFVLMDFRSEHLSAEERKQPPTFLYAADFGDDIYFVEETSLAAAPAVSFETLEGRLNTRLQSRGITITETHEIERCLFPMNLPMPDFSQPVLAFGGAASMVNPASGYMIGAMLRRSSDLANSIAESIKDPAATPEAIAASAWQALWNPERLRKYYLYRFGLEKMMRFDETQLKHFFDTFFSLPQSQWAGFLADGLTTIALVTAMVGLFGRAPNDVRWGLMQFPGKESSLLWQFLRQIAASKGRQSLASDS